ncbi:unnamed protein product [Symbiodinium sp. CCMP2456]|nr:unnamed protein product [Symbiodinium sp. CCMP2456]
MVSQARTVGDVLMLVVQRYRVLHSFQTDSKGGPGHSFLGAAAAAAALNSCARLEMQNLWVPDGETIVADDLYQFNLACRPIIELKITLRDDVYTGDRPAISYQEAEQAVTMPGAQPTLGAICAHLDNFEAALKPVTSMHEVSIYSASCTAIGELLGESQMKDFLVGPDASTAEITELLAPAKRSALTAQRRPEAKTVRKAKPKAKSAPIAAAKSAPVPSPPPVQKASYDGAALALELLEAATTQLLRRRGWFRDVRLRRSADAYMRSNKLFQKASSRQVANTGKGFEKPGPGELAAYEEDLQAHLEGLRKKLGSAPMNERREISLKSSGPGQVIGTKLKGLKKRAAELEKKPRSVIKGTLRKKRRPQKDGRKAAPEMEVAAGSQSIQ